MLQRLTRYPTCHALKLHLKTLIEWRKSTVLKNLLRQRFRKFSRLPVYRGDIMLELLLLLWRSLFTYVGMTYVCAHFCTRGWRCLKKYIIYFINFFFFTVPLKTFYWSLFILVTRNVNISCDNNIAWQVLLMERSGVNKTPDLPSTMESIRSKKKKTLIW